MEGNEAIIEAIRAIVAPLLKPFNRALLCCTVTGPLNTNTYTVKVKPLTDDGAEFDALLDGKQANTYGAILVPKQGSTVWVSRPPLAFGSAFVCKTTEVDKVLVKLGNSTLDWDANNGTLTLNGGNNKGLVIAPALQGRLNAIENDLNAIKTVFTAWVPAPGDGGAALKTAAATWAAQQLTITQLNDIQNTSITH